MQYGSTSLVCSYLAKSLVRIGSLHAANLQAKLSITVIVISRVVTSVSELCNILVLFIIMPDQQI